MSTPPSYHPIVHWRCRHCQCEGEVHVHLADTVDVRYQKVLDAHLAADPHCYLVHLASGITVWEETGSLPE